MLNKNKNKIITFLVLFFALLLKAKFAYALEVNYPSIFGVVINASTNVAQYGCYLFGLITDLAIIIAVLSITFGGVTFLVSYGSGKFTTEGKNWIKAGLTGLVLTVSAYLIAQTINPSLTVCKVSVLSSVISPVSYLGTPNSTPPPVGLNIKSYNEIPIGKLTENLLAGTNSCYEFDKNGDPIDFSTINSSASTITDDNGTKYSNSDWYIPEYINHDRVDCLMKYAEAAQKKYQLLAEIADQTSKQIIDSTGLKHPPTYNSYYNTPYGRLYNILGLFPYGSGNTYTNTLSTPSASYGQAPFNQFYASGFAQNVINNGPSVLVPDRKCINLPGAVLYNCPTGTTPTGTTCDIWTNTCKAISGIGSSCSYDSDCSSAFNGNACQKPACVCSGSGCPGSNTATCGLGSYPIYCGTTTDTTRTGGTGGGSNCTCPDGSTPSNGICGYGPSNIMYPCQTDDSSKSGFCSGTCYNTANGNSTAACQTTDFQGSNYCSSSKPSGTCNFATDQYQNGADCLMSDNTYGVCDGTPGALSIVTRSGIVDQGNSLFAHMEPIGGTGTCVNGSSSSASSSSSSSQLNWCQRSNSTPTASSSCIGGPSCAPGTKCSTNGQCLPVYPGAGTCIAHSNNDTCPSISGFWSDPCKVGPKTGATLYGTYGTGCACTLSYDNNATDGTKCVTLGGSGMNESGVCQSGSCVLPCKTDNPDDVTYCAVGTCPNLSDPNNCQTTDKNKSGYCDGICRGGSGSCQENNLNGAGFCAPKNSPGSCGPTDTACETDDSQGAGYCTGECDPNYGCTGDSPNKATSDPNTICQTNDKNSTGYCSGYCYGTQCESASCQTVYKRDQGYCDGICRGGGSCQTNSPTTGGYCDSKTNGKCSTDYTCQSSNSKQPGYCTGKCSIGSMNCQTNEPFAYSYCSTGYCYTANYVGVNTAGSIQTKCQTTNKDGNSYCNGSICKDSSDSCQTSDPKSPGFCYGTCQNPTSCQSSNPANPDFCGNSTYSCFNNGYGGDWMCGTSLVSGTDFGKECQTTDSSQPGFCSNNTATCENSGSGCQTTQSSKQGYCSGTTEKPATCSNVTPCQTSNSTLSDFCTGPGKCSDSKASCQTMYPSQGGYCTSLHGNLPASCNFSNGACQDTNSTMPGFCTGKCLDYLGNTNPGCSQASGTSTSIVGNVGSGLTSSGSGNGTITDIGNCQTSSASTPGYCAVTCKNMSPTLPNGKSANLTCQNTKKDNPGYCAGTCIGGKGDCQTVNSGGTGYCQGAGTCNFCNGTTLNGAGACQTNNPNSAGYCSNGSNGPGTCGNTSISSCQTSNSNISGFCDGKCIYNPGNDQTIQSTGSGNSGSCQTSNSSKPFYCAVGGCLFNTTPTSGSQTSSASQTTPTVPTNNGICNGLLFNHTNSYVPTVPQINPSCQTNSPLEPNYCDGTCDFTTVNACQTSIPGQPGYCSGACSLGVCQTDNPGKGGYCVLENNTATCTRLPGPGAGSWNDAPCQTSHSDQAGFCTGMCINGAGDCQTSSPTAGGYCVNSAAKCSGSSGPCQTKYPGADGYCSDGTSKNNPSNTATCADTGPCQGTHNAGMGNGSGDPKKRGYCTGTCKDDGPCQTTHPNNPGYCTNVGTVANSSFDSGAYCANSYRPSSVGNLTYCSAGGCNMTNICNTTNSESDGYCTGTCSGSWGPGGLGSCQTSDPASAGYCSGKCPNITKNLACQTSDSSVPNYCVGGTCADTTTPACQTFNSNSPGFCSGGTCNKYVSQCQTSDPNSPGFCNSQPSCNTGVTDTTWNTVIGLCQIKDSSKPGFCSGKCSDNFGACQNTNPNDPGYCSYGVDHPGSCSYWSAAKPTSADNCQTSDPTKPGYCRNGVCAYNNSANHYETGPCNTTDPTSFGYCTTSATCATNKGACQTNSANQPGYCNTNPTCVGSGPCQQKDPSKSGYCKNGKCNGNGACQNNNPNVSGYCGNNAVCNNNIVLSTNPSLGNLGTFTGLPAQSVDPTQTNFCPGPVDATGHCFSNLIYFSFYNYNFSYNNICPTSQSYANPCLCQTEDAKASSYCSNPLVASGYLSSTANTAVCSDNFGPCQTSDPGKPGYCVNGTCSNNETCKCQTADSGKPGFCSGTCSDSSSSSANNSATTKPGYCDNTVCLDSAPTCQTDKPSNAGYCTGKCNSNTCIYDLSQYSGLSEFNGRGGPATKDIIINGKTVTLINKTSWKQGSLASQLGYITGVITTIDTNIRKDESALDQAKTTLNQCYAPTTYGDLIKSYQNLNKKDAVCQSTWSEQADFCASTSNMCSDNFGNCQDTDSNGAGFCKGKCINSIAPCQTDSPGYAGYCEATCADDVATCQDTNPNANSYCSDGKCADSKDACQTDDPKKDGFCGATCSSNDPCQNTDPNEKGYCQGSCNGNGPCQTNDNTKSGYCLSQATCVENLGNCQTTDNTKPGYCNGTCNNMTDAVWVNPSVIYPPATCQTKDISSAGYCTGSCNNATNFCQTTDSTQPGYCMSFSGGSCSTTNAVCQSKDENAPGYCPGACTNMQDNFCQTNTPPASCKDNGPCQDAYDQAGYNCLNGSCKDNGPCKTSCQSSPNSYGYCKGGSCVENSEPPVDTTKYCAGFSYDSSASDCFAQCKKQYSDSSSSDFISCTNTCTSSCSSICTQKYAYNSVEYTSCQAQCTNAQCLANNAKACALCQSGSNEYAGYPDCLNPECISDSDCSSPGSSSGSATTATCNNGICGVKCKSDAGCPTGEQSCLNGICYKQCSKDDDCPNGKMCTNGVCVRKYSSSFLYDNIQKEKCANPYIAASSGSVCYSSSGASCQQTCPETAKCPTSSSCPNCPCGQQSASFLVPAKSDICNTGMQGASQKVTVPIANQLVNGTCDKEIYSKDPLTFYCQGNWFSDPSRDGLSINPFGSVNNCGKNQEIPVGQAVDDAENWANNLNLSVSNFVNSLSATSGTRNELCTWNTGNVPDWKSPDGLNCLSAVWNQNISVKNNYINLYKFGVQDSRSDPLKELTYSRQLIDTSGKISTNINTQTRLLNCTRAEDEVVPSIVSGSTTFMDQTTKGYCYGQKLGRLYNSAKLPGGSLTDNWFFCEPQSNSQ